MTKGIGIKDNTNVVLLYSSINFTSCDCYGWVDTNGTKVYNCTLHNLRNETKRKSLQKFLQKQEKKNNYKVTIKEYFHTDRLF